MLRRTGTFLAVLSLLACGGDKSIAPEDRTIVGRWVGDLACPALTLDLIESGGQVSGTHDAACGTASARDLPVTGTVTGHTTVSLSFIGSATAGPTTTFVGTLDGDGKMRGVFCCVGNDGQRPSTTFRRP